MCQANENPLKIPTLDEQVRAAISHLRLTTEHRLILDKVIKYKNLEYVLSVITGTIRKSLDAYVTSQKELLSSDFPKELKILKEYNADFLTPKTWPNFAKKQRFNIHNYLGYAEWIENAIIFRLKKILEEIENQEDT